MAKKRKADAEDESGLEDELEDEDAEDEDEEQPKKKAKKGKKKTRVGEDDDEDDDEDDEGDIGRKKKRKTVRNQFIDDIADVEDDEEEEEDDEEDGDLIDDRDEIVNEEPVARQGHAEYRKMNWERERDERSAEEIAREYEERMARTDVHGGEYGPTMGGHVEQQALLPTYNDPKLWLIHCRPGHERELVTQLLQKYYSRHRENQPLTIKSAICQDHLKGYVYIEAEKEAAVRDAIKGLRNVFASKGIQLVPIDQMVDAITVNRKAKTGIARDSWVRIRNGLYKDDLAKVVEVDTAAQKATVLLVPRLDLHAMADRANDAEARRKNPFGRTGAVRPPPKPFNAEEARNLALAVQRATGIDGQVVLMLGTHRFVNGYTQRDIALKSLISIEGLPPVDEYQRWVACGAAAEETGRSGAMLGAGTGDLSSLVAALPTGAATAKATFLKGDLVAIVRGDLKGIEAVVDSTRDDGKIMVKPIVEGFDEAVDFDMEDLRKVFKVGDHVKIVHGPYIGEVGVVLLVNQEEDQCIVISDATRREIKTFGRDMTTTDVTTAAVEVLGTYQLHDLVQLDHHTAGVIINIQRESARVLTTASAPDAPDIRVVRATDIQRGLKTRNMKATDSLNNEVGQGDYVHFGPEASATRSMQQGGTVAYVWRRHLFIKSNEFMDTGGFLCVRADKCKLRGAKAQSKADYARLVAANGYIRKPNAASGASRGGFEYMPASPSQYAMQTGSNSYDRQGAGGGGGGLQASPGRPGFRPPPPRMAGGPPQQGTYSGGSYNATSANALVGKTVKLAGGQYNGYRGRVKHETGTHVQLELDAISGRIVTVDKKHVREESATGRPQPTNYGNRTMAPHPSQASEYDMSYGSFAYGTRTPLHPSQTPLHPSMTPAHYSMHATPSHAPYTPMHAPTPTGDNYLMLNQTHPGDRGPANARTPGLVSAYTPGAFTPSAPSPAPWSDTPAAPTPALTAPTPALDATAGDPPIASTPGLVSTPGAPIAPTPFLSAPTPAITPGDTLGTTPMLGTTPAVAPTPHVPGAAFTPHIAQTPTLPASTPGPDAAMYIPGGSAGAGAYALWEGLVVRLVRGTDAGQLAAVQKATGSSLHVVRGTLASSNGNFVEDPGVVEEVVSVDAVELVRPEKKNRIRVLHVPDNPAAIGAYGTVKGVLREEYFISLTDPNELCIAAIGQVGRLAIQDDS